MRKLPLRVIPVPGPGAEDVLVDPRGNVWTGTEDGTVWSLAPDGSAALRIGNTGGRPLGLEWLGETLVICDASRGLLAMDPANGAVTELVREVNDTPIGFCNNAAVASDGSIWFSDSSTRHPIERWRNDLVENVPTGRLLCRDPLGEVTVELDGLAFANGVALSHDESFVCVAETGERTVVRLWLKGPKQGEWEMFVPRLPGYPDNISRGSDGLIWVTVASPFDALLESLRNGPTKVRRMATRLPDRMQPQPARTVRVQAYDDAGTLVHDLRGDASHWHMATGVREHEGRVWLGSLMEAAVAVLDVPRG